MLRSVSAPRLTASLTAFTASGAEVAISLPRSTLSSNGQESCLTVSSRPEGKSFVIGAIVLTKLKTGGIFYVKTVPNWVASNELIPRPVNKICFALEYPTNLGSLCVAPKLGIIPSLVSGNASFASLPARIIISSTSRCHFVKICMLIISSG